MYRAATLHIAIEACVDGATDRAASAKRFVGRCRAEINMRITKTDVRICKLLLVHAVPTDHGQSTSHKRLQLAENVTRYPNVLP